MKKNLGTFMEQKDIISRITSKYKNDKGVLIPILQEIQESIGYFSSEIVEELSKQINVSETEIIGVISFYTQFKLNKPGKYIIKVCHGTACHINGANRIQEKLEEILHIKKDETTEDGLFTIEEVACLGCCSLAPVMMINDQTYGNLTDKKVEKIIKDYIKKEKNEELLDKLNKATT